MTKTEITPKNKKSRRIRSLIFRIILIVIAGLTVGFGFYSWNASRVVGNQLPMPFGFGASVVLSGSMEPELKVNDLVFIVESDDYQVDDIVVYQSGNELIIHRIVRMNGDMIVTQGDANLAADDPITLDMIKGKYSFRIPFVGLIFRFLKTLPGILVVLALVVFLMYRSRHKERISGEEDLEKIVEEIRRLQSQQIAGNAPSADTTSQDAASFETADPTPPESSTVPTAPENPTESSDSIHTDLS